jgi:hypothetical protein
MSEQPESQKAAAMATNNVTLRLKPAQYPDGPPLYANVVNSSLSPHDVTLHFGWFSSPLLEEAPTGTLEIPVRAVASISLPLTMVRNLIKLLEAQADNWEANSGQTLPDARGLEIGEEGQG